MIKIIQTRIGNSIDCQNIVEYTCSEVADLENLPKLVDGVASGSSCICTEDGSIHMLGADDAWYNLTSGGESVKKPKATVIFEDYYNDEYISNGAYASADDIISYSTDGGVTWKPFNSETLTIKADRVRFKTNEANDGQGYCVYVTLENGETDIFEYRDITIIDGSVYKLFISVV